MLKTLTSYYAKTTAKLIRCHPAPISLTTHLHPPPTVGCAWALEGAPCSDSGRCGRVLVRAGRDLGCLLAGGLTHTYNVVVAAGSRSEGRRTSGPIRFGRKGVKDDGGEP